MKETNKTAFKYSYNKNVTSQQKNKQTGSKKNKKALEL